MTSSLLAVNDPLIVPWCRLKHMDSPGKRLQRARKEAGFASATEAAVAMGAKPPTYLGHENGTTPLTRAVARYAKFFGVSIDWLQNGGPDPKRKRQVAVVSYVGAGAEVHPVDDNPRGRGLELVDPPPGASDCVAARIKGDSMHPLRDGWLVFWYRSQQGVPEECLGSLCIVQVREGPTLLKDLRRGSRKGRYTLESWNAPPREDVQLEWASKIIDIRPR